MGIFRSEAMEHGTLIIPTDRAVEIIELLGERGEVMIQDMNATSMKRPYRRYVQRIEEIERQLRYLLNEIGKLPGAKIIAGDVEHFLNYDGFVLEGVEESLKTLTDQFIKFRSNNDDLMLQRTLAVMNRAVAKVAAKSLDSSNKRNPENLVTQQQSGAGAATGGLLSADAEQGAGGIAGAPSFSAFAGVVKQDDVDKLTRTIFRATRGNAFTYYEQIDEEDSSYLKALDQSNGAGAPAADAAAAAQTAAKNGPVIPRNVFVVYYPGGESSAMHEKISRICKAFGIETFDWPRSSQDAQTQITKLSEVIADKSKALEAFEEYFFDEVAVLLQPVHPGGNSLIEDWRLFCLKQKAIYGCLNLFEETDSTLRADCWYPAKSDEQIRDLLRQSATQRRRGFDAGANGASNNALVNSNQDTGTVSAFLLADSEGTKLKNPPTLNKVNEFTECFQNMVDTYGIPRYQEANPALLTTVTFPFMFGVMYGDVGHGILVALFGFLLIMYQNKKSKGVKQQNQEGEEDGVIISNARVGGGNKDDEVVGLIVYGRFMIFLMGLFAIFSGFVYNDFFSLGFNIYGSRYKVKSFTGMDDSELISDTAKKVTRYWPIMNADRAVYPEKIVPAAKTVSDPDNASFPYPFGIDPIWKDADNELDMLNSYKMKLSVLLGFIHMMFGVTTKGLNAIYFKDMLTFFFEFIPQFIFMTCFVGYMDVLIIVKWCQEYHGQPRASIISTLINMAMLKEITKDDEFFPNQQRVERILLLIVLICVPWMLIFKPVLSKIAWSREHEKRAAVSARAHGTAGESRTLLEADPHQREDALVNVQKGDLDGEEAEETFEFGEVFIEQTIETIEFVLGSISNTASYLRLWALSLAHQQLASVFFEQILLNIIKAVVKPDGGIANTIVGGIAVFFGFGAFAVITFAIMLCMDTLECYLHALRLHWVEYQNKFFKADGYRFIPFSFSRILTGADVE